MTLLMYTLGVYSQKIDFSLTRMKDNLNGSLELDIAESYYLFARL